MGISPDSRPPSPPRIGKERRNLEESKEEEEEEEKDNETRLVEGITIPPGPSFLHSSLSLSPPSSRWIRPYSRGESGLAPPSIIKRPQPVAGYLKDRRGVGGRWLRAREQPAAAIIMLIKVESNKLRVG